MSDSRDLAQLRVEAEDIARQAGQDVTTVHLLLAIFTVPCPARTLLLERGVDELRLLAALRAAPKEPEARLLDLLQRTREIAAGLGVEADSLHLLIALSRSQEAQAHALLEACAVPLHVLRNTILSWYTSGRIPRQYVQPNVPTRPVVAEIAPQRRAADRRMPSREPAPVVPPPDTALPRSRDQRSLGDLGNLSALVEKPPEPWLPEPWQDPARASPGPAGEPSAAEHSEAERSAAEMPVAFASSPAPDSAEEPQPWQPAFDPLSYPNLSALGRNLTEAAFRKELDPVIGRDREVEAVVDILGKRRGNNPVLVGEPGVGKTSIAEGVAQRLLGLESDRVVIELETSQLVAGTSLRGAFAERLEAIKDEVRRAEGRIVLFIDEIHTLVGAGAAGDGAQDAANGLKASLARGELPCIGATTHDEYRKFIEADPALDRRLTAVVIEEPTLEESVRILEGLAGRYASHHRVLYTQEALEAAVGLSARHVHDRQLPDKAIQIIDLAGSRAFRKGSHTVDVQEVAEVVAEMARIPKERLLQKDSERLLRLEEELASRVVGHEKVVEDVARTLRSNYAGFASRRPMGSFLFLGPTGVGKTELAKALADVVYGSDRALVRFDMSELSEAHGVARLVGAPPGYVGYGEGGQLTEAIRRRPSSVVLFDEIEKAHRDVWMVLLQVLDEARLTDGNGRQVDFSQTIVILTSNLGAEAFGAGGLRMGFGRGSRQDAQRERAMELAQSQIPPELWNRIDERCLFSPLEREDIAKIARALLRDSAARLWNERQIHLELDDQVIDLLLENGGFDAKLGARPMRRAIQRLIEAPLADAILRGSVAEGASVLGRVEAEAIAFVEGGAAAPPPAP